eukprot:scaffold30437_cov45-Attheya_sp.AAC.3
MVRETRNNRKAIQSMKSLLSEDMDIPGVMKETENDSSLNNYWKRMSQCQEIDYYCRPPLDADEDEDQPPSLPIDHTLQRAVLTLESLQSHKKSSRGLLRLIGAAPQAKSSRKRSKPSSAVVRQVRQRHSPRNHATYSTVLPKHPADTEHANDTSTTMEERQSSPCNGPLLNDNHHRCSPPSISASSSHHDENNVLLEASTTTTDNLLLGIMEAAENRLPDDSTAPKKNQDNPFHVWNQESLSQELCAFETKLQAAAAVVATVSTTGEQETTPKLLDGLILGFYNMKKRLLSLQVVDPTTTGVCQVDNLGKDSAFVTEITPSNSMNGSCSMTDNDCTNNHIMNGGVQTTTTSTTHPSRQNVVEAKKSNKRRLSHEQLQQAPPAIIKQQQRPSTSRYQHLRHIKTLQRRTPQRRDISERDAWLVQRRLLQLHDEFKDAPSSSSVVHFRTPPAG